MDDPAFSAAVSDFIRAEDEPARLSWHFVKRFPITGASVATLGELLGSETISASDTVAARLDEVQFDLGEGPCWDAMNLARPILVPDVLEPPGPGWPAFSAAVSDEPVTSIFAFPLIVGPLRIGAVDLYAATATHLNSMQAHQVQGVAAAIGKQILRRALRTNDDDDAYAGYPYSRRLVHQATGMVLTQLKISADDALLIIQAQAFAAGHSMMHVAQEILDRRMVFTRDDTG